MPQEMQVLRCYRCEAFQVHIVKKVPKWECKVCGEKQSVKKVYGRGSGRDCRLHVQQLNQNRLEAVQEPFKTETPNFENPEIYNGISCTDTSKTSRWAEFMARFPSSPGDTDRENNEMSNYTFEGPVKRCKHRQFNETVLKIDQEFRKNKVKNKYLSPPSAINNFNNWLENCVSTNVEKENNKSVKLVNSYSHLTGSNEQHIIEQKSIPKKEDEGSLNFKINNSIGSCATTKTSRWGQFITTPTICSDVEIQNYEFSAYTFEKPTECVLPKIGNLEYDKNVTQDNFQTNFNKFSQEHQIVSQSSKSSFKGNELCKHENKFKGNCLSEHDNNSPILNSGKLKLKKEFYLFHTEDDLDSLLTFK